MDSRINPFDVLGIGPGDAKVLRNAGARVTDDVLRTLVLAVYLLGVHRVLVMPHTHCRMAESTDEQIHRLVKEQYDVDTRSLDFRTDPDQVGALKHDLIKIYRTTRIPDAVSTWTFLDPGIGPKRSSACVSVIAFPRSRSRPERP